MIMGNKSTKIQTIDVESQEEVKEQQKITYFFKTEDKSQTKIQDEIVEELKQIKC